MIDTTYYTTTGPVRGECGHRHRTVLAAYACLKRDGAGWRAGVVARSARAD